VAVSTAKLSHARATQALVAARVQLALAWGSEVPAYDEVAGDFYALSAVPAYAELAGLLEENPDLARWATETRRRQAVLNLERARAVPGLNLRGGVAHFGESDDTAFIVGLAIPLQTFDRNQGQIEATTQMLAKTRDDSKAAQLSLRTALAGAVQGLSTAFTEAGLLRDEVLPAARSAYEAAEEGYRQGKFDYLEVLDAQRTLFEARVQYVSSLTTYHKTKAAIERLIAHPLPEPHFSATATGTPGLLSEDLSHEK
jgi:cobalt-zinc-cadmium efflux system outer membrane protein